MQKVSQGNKHLYDHFLLEDNTQFVNDTSIIFIDKTDPPDPLKREQYWRHTLKTLVPFSLNVSESVWLHDFVNYYRTGLY